MDNEKTQIFRDFSKIGNNKNLINTHLECIDWSTELQVNHNNADLSSELFFKKTEQLINFWTPLQRVSNKKKKLENKPWVKQKAYSSKANHFNNFFQENKLNLFKTWEGIRKIINLTIKGSKEINCIQVGNKTGQFVCGVFLDLLTAFDTVNHTILLKILTHYGITGIADKWFQSFLEDRKQFTSVQSSKSAEKPIKYGIRQGSVSRTSSFYFV